MRPGAGLAVLVLWLAPAPARALETRVPMERLWIVPGGGLWGVEDARVTGHLRVVVDAAWSVSGAPFSLGHAERASGTDSLGQPVRRLGTLQLSGAVDLWRQLRLGLALPLLFPRGDGLVALGGEPLPSAAVGDLRLHATAPFLAGRSPFVVAMGAVLSLPTGDSASFAGLDTVAVEPRVLLSVQPLAPLALHGRVGVSLHEERVLFDATWGDRLTWGAGVALGVPWIPGLGRRLALLAEVDGASDGSGGLLEMRAGLRLRLGRLHISLGSGGGIGRGVTTPSWRLLGSVGATLGPGLRTTPPAHYDAVP